MSAKISGFSRTYKKTPTIETSAYAAADALGNQMEIDLGFGDDKAFTSLFLVSMSGYDLASQQAEIDIMFFDRAVTPATDNAAADFTDADLAFFLGGATIKTTDYKTLNDNSVFWVDAIGRQLKIRDKAGLQASTKATSKIYAYAVSRGTPTYVATSDLSFNFEFAIDM